MLNRDLAWDGLYKAGGVTALILVAIPLVQLVVFVAPPPLEGSAVEWFTLFQENAILRQYTTATAEAQKAIILGAGEAMVAAFHGTAFQVSYILGSVTGFLVGAAMLRGRVFSKATAYLWIGSGIFDFGIFIPGIGLYISILSVLLLLAFHILVGRRLLQANSPLHRRREEMLGGGPRD